MSAWGCSVMMLGYQRIKDKIEQNNNMSFKTM